MLLQSEGILNIHSINPSSLQQKANVSMMKFNKYKQAKSHELIAVVEVQGNRDVWPYSQLWACGGESWLETQVHKELGGQGH